MRIVAVNEQTIQLGTAARNASISFDSMTASAIVVQTDVRRNGKPLIGIAFDSIGRYGHGGLLRERFIPRLTAANPCSYEDTGGGIDPHRAWDVVMKNEKSGGHGERSGAVGLIDAALWDLAAKYADEPLWSFLARRYGAKGHNANSKIEVYASGGHHGVGTKADLCDKVRRAIARGHRRFKIKIGADTLQEDLARIEDVLAMLEGGMTLAVDANGTFDLDNAILYLEALSRYPLAWIEEPVPPLDFDTCRHVAESSRLPIATGENLFSRDDARNLLRYAGLRSDRDVLQFDISLSYGIVEYLRILDDLERYGWRRERCAPHAGHLLAMHCVAGLGLGLAEVALNNSQLFSSLTASVPLDRGISAIPDFPGVGLEHTPAFKLLFKDLLN